MISLVVDLRDPELVPYGPAADGSSYRPVRVSVATSRVVRLTSGGFLWDGAPVERSATTADEVTFSVPATDGAEILAADRSTFVYVVTVEADKAGIGSSRQAVTFRGLLPTSLGATVQVANLVNTEPLPAPFTSIQDIIDGVADINDPAIAATIVTASLTQAALDGRYEARQSTYRATGSDTAAQINTFLAAASPLGVKKMVGTFAVAGALTFAGKALDLADAVITSTVTSASLLTLSGDNVTLSGGTITGPSSWDGSNSEWTYAVIHATGANPTVRGMTLNNVRRVGIGFKNASGVCRALDNTIVGNYPAGSWTEVETVHMGIGFDPGTDAALIARGNSISSCVQGIFLGNYGGGSSIGSVIEGNTFRGCHNHAVYGSVGVTAAVVANNTMVDCSRPIALTGAGHTVSNNSMTTTLASGNLSEACSINLRSAIDCTVSGNYMKGTTHATSPAIDLSRIGADVTISGNRVIGNRVEVTGTNTGSAIRIGSGAETTVTGNIVANNDVRALGVANSGVIVLQAASGAVGHGNKVRGNNVVIAGNSNGIHIAAVSGADVTENHVRLEFSSGSAATLGGVSLSATSAKTKVRGNTFDVPSTFGTNVTFRAVWESSGTTGNRIGPNTYNLDATLATVVNHIIQGTSSSVLAEVGMTGAPATVCGPGSTWTRADGGAATTFYVKETAASSATWRAV